MFTTAQDVMDITPYTEVTNKEVQTAQFIIETYVGRTEADVTDARDKSILARAVVAQTVYMRQSPKIAFEQIAASTIQSGEGMTVFKAGDWTAPFIAPLAVIGCRKLSWAGSRSVRIGRIFQRRSRPDWSRD